MLRVVAAECNRRGASLRSADFLARCAMRARPPLEATSAAKILGYSARIRYESDKPAVVMTPCMKHMTLGALSAPGD
jgi:hypothetical protein